MTQGQRHREILEYLEKNQELVVEEACKLYNASPATIRRDFVELTEQGYVDKTWGGIVRKTIDSQPNGMLPLAYRQAQNNTEKILIAQKAASFVQEGDVVIVDGGTTTFYMAKYLANKRIRVITNSIIIAYQIDKEKTDKNGAEVILTGGILYQESGILVGPLANENIKKYSADWAFLSAGALDEQGPTNSNQLVVETEQIILSQCKKSVLLADSSKFGKKHMCLLSDWTKINVLITDNSTENSDLIHKIGTFGVEIHTLLKN